MNEPSTIKFYKILIFTTWSIIDFMFYCIVLLDLLLFVRVFFFLSELIINKCIFYLYLYKCCIYFKIFLIIQIDSFEFSFS